MTSKTERYLARYFYDDSWWGVDIYATDFDDAKARCNKLGLQLDGKHFITLPSFVGYSVAKLMDLWHSLKGN